MGFVGYSIPEIRRMLQLLGQADAAHLTFHLHWSLWRREHQWQAGQAHRRRRAQQLATAPVPQVALDLPAPLILAPLPSLTPTHWERIVPLLPP